MNRSLSIALVCAALAMACASDRPWTRPDPAAASQGARMESPAAASSATRTTTPSTSGSERPVRPRQHDGAPVLETMEGRVSYYSDSLAGRPTASGEPYDPHALTAASPSLPFGTLVRVTRPDTGASVVVRINDRGPNGGRGRIMDLSRAAAEALDMIRVGVAQVQAEVLAAHVQAAD